MKKERLFRVIALFTSAVLVFSMTSVTAFATETSPVIVHGGERTVDSVVVSDEVEHAVMVTDGGSVEVQGDVIYAPDTTHGTAVWVEDEESKVEISGNVGSVANGVLAKNEDAEIYIKGSLEADDVAIVAQNGAMVTIDGSVVQSGDGVEATGDDTSVFIQGDLNAYDTGIVAAGDSLVVVGGSVNDTELGARIEGGKVVVGGNMNTDGVGAVLTTGGTLLVGGDVTGDGYGIGFDMSHDPSTTGSDYEVVVEGTLKAEDEDGYALFLVPPASTPSSELHILVYKIEASDGHVVYVHEGTEEMVETVKNAIDYIIRYQDPDNAGNMSGYEDQYFGEGNSYKTIKKNGSITISLNSDYYIQGSNDITITPNSDGTYSITMKEGSFGGIDIQVLKRAIEEVTGGGGEDPGTPSEENTPAPAAVVVRNSSVAALSQAPGAVVPARTVSFNVSDVTPEQMKAAIVENIAATPAGGALRIETDQVSCLDAAMLQAFAEKGNIDLELIFTYNGQKMRVVIPRGTDIHRLLDAKGYCGFLRLADLLGFQLV